MFKGSKFCVQENCTRLTQPCPFPCFSTQTTSWEEHSERANNNNHEKESKSRHKRRNRPLLIQYQIRSHDWVRIFHVDIKIFPIEPGFHSMPLFPFFVACTEADRSPSAAATAARESPGLTPMAPKDAILKQESGAHLPSSGRGMSLFGCLWENEFPRDIRHKHQVKKNCFWFPSYNF